MTADEVVPPAVGRLAGLVGPGGDEILAEMETHARRRFRHLTVAARRGGRGESDAVNGGVHG